MASSTSSHDEHYLRFLKTLRDNYVSIAIDVPRGSIKGSDDNKKDFQSYIAKNRTSCVECAKAGKNCVHPSGLGVSCEGCKSSKRPTHSRCSFLKQYHHGLGMRLASIDDDTWKKLVGLYPDIAPTFPLIFWWRKSVSESSVSIPYDPRTPENRNGNFSLEKIEQLLQEKTDAKKRENAFRAQLRDAREALKKETAKNEEKMAEVKRKANEDLRRAMEVSQNESARNVEAARNETSAGLNVKIAKLEEDIKNLQDEKALRKQVSLTDCAMTTMWQKNTTRVISDLEVNAPTCHQSINTLKKLLPYLDKMADHQRDAAEVNEDILLGPLTFPTLKRHHGQEDEDNDRSAQRARVS